MTQCDRRNVSSSPLRLQVSVQDLCSEKSILKFMWPARCSKCRYSNPFQQNQKLSCFQVGLSIQRTAFQNVSLINTYIPNNVLWLQTWEINEIWLYFGHNPWTMIANFKNWKIVGRKKRVHPKKEQNIQLHSNMADSKWIKCKKTSAKCNVRCQSFHSTAVWNVITHCLVEMWWMFYALFCFRFY